MKHWQFCYSASAGGTKVRLESPGVYGTVGVPDRVLPVLRSSPYLQSAEFFPLPPLKGALKQRGMPSFSAYLKAKADDIEAIRSYLIGISRATLRGATAALP